MGQQPLMPHEVPKMKSRGKCPAAYRYPMSQHELIDKAKDSLAKAIQKIKKYADKKGELWNSMLEIYFYRTSSSGPEKNQC